MEYTAVEGAGHAFHLEPLPGTDLRPEVLAFFDEHLQPGGAECVQWTELCSCLAVDCLPSSASCRAVMLAAADCGADSGRRCRVRRVVPDETAGAFSTIHVHMMSHDAMAAARFYERMFGARVIASQGANGLPRANMSMGGLTYLISQVVSCPGRRHLARVPSNAPVHVGSWLCAGFVWAVRPPTVWDRARAWY